MKLELRLRLRLAMTTPSNAWTRLRVPSTTLTLTMTVSPGANAGIAALQASDFLALEGLDHVHGGLLRSCARAEWRLAGRSGSARCCPEPKAPGAEDRKTRNYSFGRLSPERNASSAAPEQPGGAGRLDEVGASHGGQRERLLATPGVDRGVIAGEQHVGDGGAVGEAFRPAVVRAVEEAGGEAVLLVRAGVAEDARLQAGEAIEQDERRQLAAGEHVVADAELEIDVGVDEALVDALVAGTEQDRARAGGELRHRGLAKRRSRRAEAHQRHRLRFRPRGADRRQGALERLDQQHHSRAAAVRPVVDARVRWIAEVAQRPEMNVDPPRLEGTSRHAVRRGAPRTARGRG